MNLGYNLKNISVMKKYMYIGFIYLALLPLFLSGCDTDDYVYLTTDNDACYISSLQIYGPDNRNTVVGSVTIDDDKNTIMATVKNGTNLARVKPRCGLAPESTVLPKMGTWTDMSKPVQYTVTSGNKEVQKTYTITLIEQQ